MSHSNSAYDSDDDDDGDYEKVPRAAELGLRPVYRGARRPPPASSRDSITSTPVSPVISRATAAGYSSTISLSDASTKLKAAGRLYPTPPVAFRMAAATPASTSSTGRPMLVAASTTPAPELSTTTTDHDTDLFSKRLPASSGANTSKSINVSNGGSSGSSSSSIQTPGITLSTSPIPLLAPVPQRSARVSSPISVYPAISPPASNPLFSRVTSPSNGAPTALKKAQKSKSPRPMNRSESPIRLMSPTISHHHHASHSHSASSRHISTSPPPSNPTAAASRPTPQTTATGRAGIINRFSRVSTSTVLKDRGTPDSSETEQLIRQIFLSREPKSVDWRDRLPALSSADEVNVELYALFGLVVRQFVLSWYLGIVDDLAFAGDIVAVLAHSARLVEERLARTDFYAVLFDEIPMIVEMHVQDFRVVQERYGSAILPRTSVEEAFHALRPLPALDSPEDESLFLKVLAKGLVAFLLDPKDLNSPLAVALLGSIVEKIGLGSAVDKLSEPWMLYEIITKVLQIFFPDNFPDLNEKKDVAGSAKDEVNEPVQKPAPLPAEKKLKLANYNITATANFSGQAGAVYQRVVNYFGSVIATGGKYAAFVLSFSGGEETAAERGKVPFVATALFSCVNTVFQVSAKRPLLAAAARVLSSPLAFGRAGKVTNRIVTHFLERLVVNERTAATVLRAARQTLFDASGAMAGPLRPYPSAEEQAQARRTAMQAIARCTPEHVRAVLFGDDTKLEIYKLLDLFENKQVNKHLVYNLLDHVITTLAPELVEMTPQGLIDAKLQSMRDKKK